ncbi:hypothetical protein Sjap_001210 [Stephania japonica]|uniref:Uncharacterized protein n=1 Tax=Stephania japonica TaxID=461633 RepID=A0AAP0PT39_9MAGN
MQLIKIRKEDLQHCSIYFSSPGSSNASPSSSGYLFKSNPPGSFKSKSNDTLSIQPLTMRSDSFSVEASISSSSFTFCCPKSSMIPNNIHIRVL